MALDSVSSSSTASATGSSSSYDVFLNFRGVDTRRNFVGFLYKIMHDRGISAFLDSEKLWTGEAIGPTLRKAIEGSKILIPVFSEHYADSKWCLKELVWIAECHRSSGQLVWPIFFNVDPSDVRNQNRSFAEAFKKHEKEFEPHMVKGWRDALQEVGKLKGEVLDDTKDQAEVVQSVVERALCELVHRTPLAENKYCIDMDSRVHDLLSLFDIGSDDVQFVGICGFGGIGKTTLAKSVYNDILAKSVYNGILSTFDKHCFLSEVREQATKFRGLVSLQKQFLKDIFKEDFDIRDSHKGKQLIEERVCNKRVFLVLDDVDTKEQIDALVGKFNWFGKGSKVIITTRDEHILNVAGVNKDKIYKPPLLGHTHSLQLFSWHAFQNSLPPEDYMQLSHDVVHHSGGLPLILEVFGSYLSDLSDKDEWESTLKSLKEIPPKEVQRRLRISYDNLQNDYQRNIFLDAACFFIGWEKEIIVSIWEACGYHPKSAILTLIRRSLIQFEVDHFNRVCLKMHDQIRDMGTEIVREENRMEPSKRSRLWLRDEVLEVLDRNMGTNMIKSMVLPRGLSDVNLHQQHFDMMSNLRFLDITPECVNVNFWSLPSMIRWFRWTNCPWKIIPNKFYHRGLVHLELSGFMIEQAWTFDPRDENERFQKLKILDLHSCGNLSKCPNFLWFPYLEQLDLSYCRKLAFLDESIGQLSLLKTLNLKSCEQIMELPNSIGNLKSLVKLNLSLTRTKELPDSIGNLKSLVKLNLSSTRIKELPDNISKLSSLKNLKLIGCSSLKKLPEFIGLKNLVELNFNVYGSDDEDDKDFPQYDDEGIEEVPDSVGLLENLEVLNTSGHCRIVKLPSSMGGMKCLHTLNLISANISKLSDDFSAVSNLKVLKMSWNLKSFPIDLSHLKKLRIFVLVRCKLLVELPEVSSSLVELKCVHCNSLIRTFNISRLKYLRVLRLCYCEKLNEIQGLKGTESLDYFEVTRCHNLTDTKRNVHGQGTLLVPEMSQKMDYSLCGDGWNYTKGLALCIVFGFADDTRVRQGQLVSLCFEIWATIHQKDKETMCNHTLRFEDVAYTSRRDTICLHHFKGFDWFGSPLQGRDSIVIRKISLDDSKPSQVCLKVKFWQLLFQGREADVQKPIFSWDDRPTQEEEEDDDDEERNITTTDFLKCLEFDPVPEVVGAEEVEMSKLSNRAHLFASNDEASLFSLDLNDEPSLFSLDLTLTPSDVRSNYGVNESNCQLQNEDEALLSAIGRIILENQELDEVSLAMERLLIHD